MRYRSEVFSGMKTHEVLMFQGVSVSHIHANVF